MSDFLATCKKTYSCDTQPVRRPFDFKSGDQKYKGYTFAPFIELKLTINGEYLTVGNKSRPSAGNTAVIKSLEYGASEGMGCTIEIFDEEGGNFTKSFEVINKGLGQLDKEITGFELDFGWIVEKNCGGASNIEKFSVKSIHGSPINLLPIRMNVVYDAGKIKYVLEAQDMISRVGEARHECNIGKDDAKVPLKQAIKKFMEEHLPPPFLNVKFLKHDKTEWDFANSDGGPQGPKSVWGSCQQNKLATLRRWISGLRTKDGKGIVLQWEGKEEGAPPPTKGGTVVLLEDPTPSRCETFDLCSNNIATYIVNGGNQSPVLSFNPSINWTFAPSSGAGGTMSPNAAEAKKKDGKMGCAGDDTKDSAGIQAGQPVGTSKRNYTAPGEEAKKQDAGDTAHQEANTAREILSPIEAELKIIGDPFYVFPIELVSKQISLIVLNPYHLKTTGSGGCPDWLSEPTCNPVFSNKGWTIQAVNHQIREGSYITIIKLMLPVPNVQLPPEAPLGNDPSGFKVEIKTKPKKEGKCTE